MLQKNITILLSGVCLFGLMSCAPPSTYQSPKVLNAGEKVWGVGLSLQKYDEILPTDIAIYHRLPLINKMDIGLKMSGLPNPDFFKGRRQPLFPFYNFLFDIKYGIAQEPLLISGNVGYAAFVPISFEGESRVRGFHSTLLFGREDIYGGIGWNYLIVREEREIGFEGPAVYVRDWSRESSLRIMLGSSLAVGKLKLNPELNIYVQLPIGDSESLLYQYPFVVAGLGIQYTSSRQEKNMDK